MYRPLVTVAIMQYSIAVTRCAHRSCACVDSFSCAEAVHTCKRPRAASSGQLVHHLCNLPKLIQKEALYKRLSHFQSDEALCSGHEVGSDVIGEIDLSNPTLRYSTSSQFHQLHRYQFYAQNKALHQNGTGTVDQVAVTPLGSCQR